MPAKNIDRPKKQYLHALGLTVVRALLKCHCNGDEERAMKMLWEMDSCELSFQPIDFGTAVADEEGLLSWRFDVNVDCRVRLKDKTSVHAELHLQKIDEAGSLWNVVSVIPL